MPSPDLNLSLWAVGASGVLSPLPDFESLTLSPVRNAPGAVQVTYPADGINFALLYNNITSDRDVEVEIWLAGDATNRVRALLQESSGDDAGEARIWTFAGGFLEQRMDEAVVFPQTGGTANAQQELVFSAATAGTVMSTLLSQAQARGALTDITKDFTTTADSSGVAWPNVVTTKFSPGASYLSILDTLVGLGLCEWSITADHVFHLYGPAGRGVDRTVGANPTNLYRGRNLTSAPRKHSVRQSATAVLVAGANGLYQNQTSANAQSRRGRRVEASASANNLTDSGSVTAYAASELQVLTPGLMELTVGVGFLPGQPRPGVDFTVGDWINVDTLGTLVRYRVAQWSLTLTAGSGTTPTGVVVVNDTVTDRLSALSKQLSALSSGSAVVGTSIPPNGNSTPNPPTSVTASSTAYLDGAQTKSSVLTGWTAPTNNVDGTTLNDLAGFNVEFSYASSPTIWLSGGSAPGASANSKTFVAAPGVSINIRVAAYNSVGKVSGWSTTITHITAADATAPPAPSTPVVANYLGVLQITWDGLTNTGAGMLAAAPDFDHVNIHVSTASGFTPTTTTYFDRLYAAGTQVYTAGIYGTTYFVKLVAVDTNGNTGIASLQGSDAPSQILSADLFANCVGTAQLQDLVVVTAKIANLAVNDAQIGNLSVGKITAGTLSVAVTLSGIIRTALTGARAEIDAAGIRLYDTAGTNTVNLKTTDGSALITGQVQTALAGARVVMNSGNTNPGEIRVYGSTSSGTQYASINALTSSAVGFVNQAGVTMKANSARADGQSGEASVFPDYASVAWANELGGGAVTSRVSATSGNVFMGGPKVDISYGLSEYARIGRSVNNVAQLHTQIRMGPKDAAQDGNGCVGVEAQHSYIQFDTGIVSVVNDTTLIKIQANAFVVSSERRTKTAIEPIPFDPTAVVRSATPYRYEKRDEVVEAGQARTKQLGLMVDEMPDEVRVYNQDQDLWGLDVYGVLAILWAAVRKEIGHRERSDVTLAEIERIVRGTNLRSVS